MAVVFITLHALDDEFYKDRELSAFAHRCIIINIYGMSHKKCYLKITLFQSFPMFQIDYTQWDRMVQIDRADNSLSLKDLKVVRRRSARRGAQRWKSHLGLHRSPLRVVELGHFQVQTASFHDRSQARDTRWASGSFSEASAGAAWPSAQSHCMSRSSHTWSPLGDPQNRAEEWQEGNAGSRCSAFRKIWSQSVGWCKRKPCVRGRPWNMPRE